MRKSRQVRRPHRNPQPWWPLEVTDKPYILDGCFTRSSRRNPGILSDHDPREEQLRAQRQGIYETSLMKTYGAESFRGPTGERLDAVVLKQSKNKEQALDVVRGHVGKAFGISTGRGHRYGWLYPGTQAPTGKTMQASRDRYAGTYVGSDGKRRTLDDLVEGRQAYEETLALARKSGFYRVTEEATRDGAKWFVWPMPPGQRVPGPAANKEWAERIATKLSQAQNPVVTGVWRRPESRFTTTELSHWLPPPEAFSPGGPTQRVVAAERVAPKKKPSARKAASSRSTKVEPEFAAKGEMREGRLIYFLVDKTGKQVSPEIYASWPAVWAALSKLLGVE